MTYFTLLLSYLSHLPLLDVDVNVAVIIAVCIRLPLTTFTPSFLFIRQFIYSPTLSHTARCRFWTNRLFAFSLIVHDSNPIPSHTLD